MEFLQLFIIRVYVWLIVILLVIILGVMVIILLQYRGTLPREKIPRPVMFKRKPHKPAAEGAFAESLGQRVVNYMIEVSRSKNKDRVKTLIRQIQNECQKLNQQNIPKENKKIISTVLIWAANFDVEKHASELALFNYSSQIKYDSEKRDFKLMITKEV